MMKIKVMLLAAAMATSPLVLADGMPADITYVKKPVKKAKKAKKVMHKKRTQQVSRTDRYSPRAQLRTTERRRVVTARPTTVQRTTTVTTTRRGAGMDDPDKQQYMMPATQTTVTTVDQMGGVRMGVSPENMR